jgi:hypothetical protein
VGKIFEGKHLIEGVIPNARRFHRRAEGSREDRSDRLGVTGL